MKKANLFRIVSLVVFAVMFMFCLTACGKYDVKLFSNVDFSNSPFKHITNGGKGGETPYNINAITGATLTIEGPGMDSSVPFSTKELENTDAGLVRGLYKDKTGLKAYEGIDVYYLLNNMGDGDNSISMTDTAYKVVFKNANREDVATLTLADIKKAHDDKQPVLITYGIGDEACKTVAPYVFSGANKGEHTQGFIDVLNNEDGCLKLVYNYTKYGSNKNYKTFSNCAYLYVEEEKTPGFKHSEATNEAYANENLTNYIISVGGKTLGYELDFTVKQLEALVEHNRDGSVKEGGLGYKDFYSLANNTYWYVNEYEGLELYKFLQYCGVPSAEALGADAEKTKVTFSASDGYTSAEKFTMAQLSDPNNFGYYKKNSADLDDGTYVSTNADLVKTGYPVMLAYGVNNYPYTITSEDEGFVPGLANDGGPMRVIFGKIDYNHANGSNQIQFLSNIVVGANYTLSTHSGSRVEAQQEYTQDKVQIKVNNVDGSVLSDASYTVSKIEDLIYGEDVTSNQIKSAKVKAVYDDNIYEGVNLEFMLSDIIGIPGTNGTVTFSNGKDELKVELSDLFEQKSIVAFAKNGSPLVPNENSDGYVASYKLNPFGKNDPAEYKVDNVGGPLMVIVPTADGNKYVKNLTSIVVNVEPDQYAHLKGDAAVLAGKTIEFYGEGVNAKKAYTVADLEGMQKMAKTFDYGKERYRGIPMYDLLLNVGLRYNASEVIITSIDGSKETFKLGDLRGEKGKSAPLLAFGVGDTTQAKKVGSPLLTDNGPLMFVSDSKKVKSVAKVEVTAVEMASWNHSASDLYTPFLKETFSVVLKTGAGEKTYEYTLEELENMTDLVERTEYFVRDFGVCEGINLWKLVKASVGPDVDLSNPIKVSAVASDNYSKDFLSIFSMDALEKGIVAADGTRKPIIVCYAIQGYPLVFDENDEGYTGLVANSDGPLRFITETNQGASIKHASKVVVEIK